MASAVAVDRNYAKELPRSYATFRSKQHIGLDAGYAAADSIHLYHGNAALLAERLEVIQRTSARILSAIETPAVGQESTDETEAEQATSTEDAIDAALAEVA